MPGKRKFFKGLLTLFLVFCVVVTITLGGLVLTNFAGLSQLIQVTTLVKTNFLWDVELDQLVEGAITGLVDSLGDEYSVYMNSEKFQELQTHIQGSFGGIGIYVGVKDGNITVIAPIEGSPAARAGIKGGDIIAKVNDFSTIGMDMDEAVSLMKGEPGTEVKVSIERPGNEQLLEFTLVREIINVPTVAGEIIPQNPDIAYLRISQFASNTDEFLTEELEKLKEEGFKALIIDLRDNPGGDLETVVNIASHFVPAGPIVHIVDNENNSQTFNAPGNNLDVPLVVLINGGSASASEILAGAIKDTKAGILIGTNTFGKGIVQSIYFLNEGAGLKLTTAKYLTPNKNDIHKKGIAPDIVVELPDYTPEQEFVEDTQLEKAIEVLEEQIGKDA